MRKNTLILSQSYRLLPAQVNQYTVQEQKSAAFRILILDPIYHLKILYL